MTQPRYELRPGTASGSAPAGRSGGVFDGDPFRYGHRWVDGEMVPLTYEDLLDPQEDDFVTDDTTNRKLANVLTYLFEQRFADETDVAIWNDFKLRFGNAGKGPGPDVCVARGVVDRDRRRGSFWVGHEPGRIALVIEIVSRQYRQKDYTDAKAIYEREKVPELILIELKGEYLSGPYKLTGYRLDASGVYREIEPDDKGGVVSEETDVRIAPDPEGWGLEVVDLRTGERLLTPEEVVEHAEQARRAAEQRAEEEASARKALEEELARLKKGRM